MPGENIIAMTAFSSFADVLRRQAAEQPDRRAFTFLENGETESDALTYAELDRDARAIAVLLQRRARAGDRALLLFPPGLDFVRAFMGCLYAGVIAVPAYPPRRNRSIDRLRAIAADAQPAAVLTSSVVSKALARGDLDALHVPLVCVDRADRDTVTDPDRFVAPPPDPTAIAFLQYTSGSTGAPKGVMVTHGNLLHNNELIKAGFDHSSDSVFVSWLPVFHDMGLVGMVLQPIYVGAPGVLMEPAAFLQKPVRWLRAISRYGGPGVRGITSGAPNSAYELCLRKVTAEDRSSLDLGSWRFAYNGSEPVRAATIRRFHETFSSCGLRKDALHPCYGLAEATLLVSVGATGTPPVFHGGGRSPELVSSGRPWLDERVLVVNPETREVSGHGEVGEIWISSPGIAAGYWHRPEETEAAFDARTSPDGDGPFFRTGDLGFLAGGDLFVTGRLKDLIIIRGRNLYPQDIERTAERAHAALCRDSSAAFSIGDGPTPTAAGGEEGIAVVCEVSRERLARLDVDEVVAALRQAIAEEHEVDPDAIVLVRPLTIPKTSSGKIQRRACRERFLSGTLEIAGEWRRPLEEMKEMADVEEAGPAAHFSPGAGPSASRSYDAMCDWLVARLAAQAGLAPGKIDIHDPFSRYGLDSQRAVMLSGELQDWLGRSLPVTLAYDFPSVDALARHLADARPNGDAWHAASAERIAIVGVGCRFPGADTPERFWTALHDGVDAVGPAPESRPHAKALGIGGFLDAVDAFDAGFFGVTPREAEAMDPQQRLLLEVAWEAVESAGMTSERLAGSRTGVFIGISTGDYARLQDGLGAATDPYAATGNALSISANRLSYQLDLRGPSWAVDTACSSSLVAVHQACESLRRGESDAALCGGVNLILSPGLTKVFSRAGMMSESCRCRTFDVAADGYVRGEGAAIVVLKRLSDARRDGDTIWALIRGSAVNQDGRSNGLTAPNGPAQQAVVRAALGAAGVAPAAIGYVEAHGTGTTLGDPIEMNALMDVLAAGRSPSAPCWIGSVKTNIGHLEAAAGIAGLVKVALAMRHREIPPHLHFTRANPHIAFGGRPFSIPTALQPWVTASGPRLAGISSFGFGGTNAHVVLEEAETERDAEAPAAPDAASIPERPLHVLTLSATSETALLALAERTASHLRQHPDVGLADAAFCANVGRTAFPHTLAVVAASAGDAAHRLSQAARAGTAPGVFRGHAGRRGAPKVAFLFAGQGSQHAGVARDLFETQPVFRAALSEFEEGFRRVADASLLDVIYPSGAGSPSLDDTVYAQPALFAIECALARLWKSWGVEPAVVLGHSVGEYAAACVAGMFGPAEGQELVAARARLMQSLPRIGSMRVVFAERGQVEPALAAYGGHVTIAAVNGPRNVVVSGRADAIDALAAEFTQAGIASRPLRTSHAFHSPLMQPIVDEFQRIAGRIAMRPPVTPIVSNLSGRAGAEWAGRAGGDFMCDAEYWGRHILEPVQFASGVETLWAMGCRVFVEIGPGADLLTMAKDVLSSVADAGSVAWLPSLERCRPGWETMIEAVASLSVRGVRIGWPEYDAGYGRRRVALPTYPFERQRYWIDETQTEPAVHDAAGHPLLGRRLPELAHARDMYVWETSVAIDRLPYLRGHRVAGSAVLPYAAFVEMALAAAGQAAGGRRHRVTDLRLHQPVIMSAARPTTLQTILDERSDGGWRFRVYNRVGSTWALSASSTLTQSTHVVAHAARPGEP